MGPRYVCCWGLGSWGDWRPGEKRWCILLQNVYRANGNFAGKEKLEENVKTCEENGCAKSHQRVAKVISGTHLMADVIARKH